MNTKKKFRDSYDKFKNGFSGGYDYKSLVSKVTSKCKDVIEERFKKLKYKGENVKIREKASNKELDSYYDILSNIDPNFDWKSKKLVKNDVKKSKKVK